MMEYQRMHNYPAGSVVLKRNGTERIKTEDGWKSVARRTAELSDRVFNGGRELDENDRVFHLDNTLVGKQGYNDPKNLVVVRQNREKVKFIQSKVLFIPSAKKQPLSKKELVRI